MLFFECFVSTWCSLHRSLPAEPILVEEPSGAAQIFSRFRESFVTSRAVVPSAGPGHVGETLAAINWSVIWQHWQVSFN